jgi:hypothetical protein
LQPQRGGEQGFDGDTHQDSGTYEMALPDMVPDVNFHWKRHRAKFVGFGEPVQSPRIMKSSSPRSDCSR